ncbi:MAG: hypothetical protein RI885_1144, partial [Actinomycetota bacterium]
MNQPGLAAAPSTAGVPDNVAEAIGSLAGRMTGRCYLAGVVTGAPV